MNALRRLIGSHTYRYLTLLLLALTVQWHKRMSLVPPT